MVLKMVRMRGTILFQWPKIARGQKASKLPKLLTTSSKPLTWSYQKGHCLNVENTGASWKVNVNGTGSCKFINWYLLTANRGLLRLYWSSCCSSAISQSLLVIIRMFLIFFYLESILFSFIGYFHFSNWNIFLFLIGIFSFLSILKQACLIETFSFFWIGTSNLLKVEKCSIYS